jgi:glutathione S-transferase
MNPATRDQGVVDAALQALDSGMAHLDYFLGDGPFAVGETLSTADCSLAPPMFFLSLFAQVFGRPGLLTRHHKVAGFWTHVQTHPAAARVLGEMGEAMRTRQAAAAG